MSIGATIAFEFGHLGGVLSSASVVDGGTGPDVSIDSLETYMVGAVEGHDLVPVELPVTHHFYSSGLYAREIFMPAGTLLTSRIHKTEHPFVVLRGSAKVYIPDRGTVLVAAPHFGTTEAGTRRVLLIVEDCVWVTFHPTTADEMAEPDKDKRLSLIEDRIIERRELPGYGGRRAFDVYQELLAEAQKAFEIDPADADDAGGAACRG